MEHFVSVPAKRGAEKWELARITSKTKRDPIPAG
jgi:hypothetical protein